ncbi:hypothetical protein KIPB_000369 [Kipferlia bialata]|uniref:Uncharacterized protein n=1 Tax=Kipferlia bialata TaxID=797122 RepID=A0A9K3GEX1_9EUKA|nr:hypothetical protein KIPB_000369 [Kipferlia bialata]|eukprot:g369.t1
MDSDARRHRMERRLHNSVHFVPDAGTGYSKEVYDEDSEIHARHLKAVREAMRKGAPVVRFTPQQKELIRLAKRMRKEGRVADLLTVGRAMLEAGVAKAIYEAKI